MSKSSASAHTLMIQGTTSDAGKTVMVAAFCRILARLHKQVVPFKPQNMALNSAVTASGGEIGRAQALQAQACYLEPHTDMNPILLKPSSDTGAQVIVHGKALTAMEAGEYHDYKKRAMGAVLESHSRLSMGYSHIVVEGAGSPAEINLREGDIANMGFAEAVDCPVIIVADIDRGGVFAHLVGTLELLSVSEQSRVVGFIINRFRGDIALLQSGLDWLEARTNKPVLAVVPYIQDFYLDAEDAIDIKQVTRVDGGAEQAFTIVVPVLSRISNHTDFDALRLHPNINVRFIPKGMPIPACDLVILPGSKNVRDDRVWLRDNGWDTYIARHLRYGGKIIGICGGFQMLGESIHDPLGIEQSPGSVDGLGLIPMQTELHQHKQLKQRKGTIDLFGASVKGYEIHCGVSSIRGDFQHCVSWDDGGSEGYISADGSVMGTYLHGIFDEPQACNHLLSWAGLNGTTGAIDMDEQREVQLNRLADAVDKSIDWDKLKQVLPDLI
ncbi:MAG: adenosylcobyric acid synthase [Flavobacteriales bacterium]|jgi:adenosylcobyric acid synthase